MCPTATCYRTVCCSWPQSAQAVQSHCALPVHSMRRSTSAPVPAAQGCNCLLLADAAVVALPSQIQGGSWGLFGREGKLGGQRGSSQARQDVGSGLMVSALKIFDLTCSCSSGPFYTPVTNAGLALSPPSL